MGVFRNVLGTIFPTFKVGKSTLSAGATVANTVGLPYLTGKVMAYDPAGGRITYGNDTTDVDAVFRWERDNAVLDIINASASAFGGVASLFRMSGSTSFVTRNLLFEIEALGTSTFMDSVALTMYVRAGNVMVANMLLSGVNVRMQSLSLGAADGSGFSGSFAPDVTANRNYSTPDRDGTMSLDDEQSIVGLTIQTAPTGNVITVGEGSAYVPSVGKVVNFAGGTITGNPTTNTFYHIYLLANGTVEKSTTAPAAPYAGTARAKTSDTSRRYLGTVRSISGTSYIPQRTTADGNEPTVYYLWNSPASSSLLAGGTSTSAVDVSAASFVPSLAITLTIRLQNTGTANVRLYGWDGTAHVLWTNTIPATNYMTDIPCDTTPKIRYDVIAGGICGLVLYGYTYSR